MNDHHNKPRLLTGDTPTGNLHLGHWVGSLENRVSMQDQYDCYFLIANTHAFTTHVNQPKQIHENALGILLDYLSAGIDPVKSTIFIESDIPVIFALTTIFSMLIPFPRLMRNPTIKNEIHDKQLGDQYSMGFLMYPIMQVADILAFQAAVVPVGEDQIPHLELTREVARRFNQIYCDIDPHASDEEVLKAGGVFQIPAEEIGRVRRLIGLGPPGKDGQLFKMSKSLDNALFLSDTPDVIQRKIMNMYTDPKRIHATDPGHIENNPLWILHDTFNSDKQWVFEAKQQYQEGKIGDVTCKKKLIDALVTFLAPFQQRRDIYKEDPAQLIKILKEGAEKANVIAEETLNHVKSVMHLTF